MDYTLLAATKKVSVCLCTFNGALFLHQQLDSIINQTLPPDEIVIVDDCSLDSTKGVLLDYERSFPSLFRVFFNSKNLGYKKNFSKVLSLAVGSIIFFADQDDIWDKTKIEKIVSVFDHNPNASSVCSYLELIDNAGKRLGKSSYNTCIRKVVHKRKQWKCFGHHPFIPGTALAIRRSLMATYWPIPNGFLHDEWFSLCSSFRDGVFVVPENLVFYRQHVGQAIGDHHKTFSEKRKTEVDFESINRQYNSVCVSRLIPSPIQELFKKRAKFFTFREELRKRRFFQALLFLLLHPNLFFSYFSFCDTPFLSIGKDLVVYTSNFDKLSVK